MRATSSRSSPLTPVTGGQKDVTSHIKCIVYVKDPVSFVWLLAGSLNRSLRAARIPT